MNWPIVLVQFPASEASNHADFSCATPRELSRQPCLPDLKRTAHHGVNLVLVLGLTLCLDLLFLLRIILAGVSRSRSRSRALLATGLLGRGAADLSGALGDLGRGLGAARDGGVALGAAAVQLGADSVVGTLRAGYVLVARVDGNLVPL